MSTHVCVSAPAYLRSLVYACVYAWLVGFIFCVCGDVVRLNALRVCVYDLVPLCPRVFVAWCVLSVSLFAVVFCVCNTV